MARDDFEAKTRATLAKRVGYLCSKPECRQLTSGPRSDPEKHVNVGVAAHITAASKGGPRYDESLTSKQRRLGENGIWLCQNHAKLIDNDEEAFPVELLKSWKKEAEEFARQAIAGGPAAVRTPMRASVEVECPYRGLRAFDESHANQFYGRADDVHDLIQKLRSSSGLEVEPPPGGVRFRLRSLIGVSGSGKSSLAGAGLVPAVRRGALGGGHWNICLMRPGRRPVYELALRVGSLAAPADGVGSLAASILQDRAALSAAYDRHAVCVEGEARLLLIVDQLEELFSGDVDEAERGAFLEALLHAASVPGGRVFVVLTLRADDLGLFLSNAAVGQAPWVRESVTLMRSMTRAELTGAVVRPAEALGVQIEGALVDELVSHVLGEPAMLPLLQFVLEELWQRLDGDQMTWSAYRDIGGYEGAIASRLDDVLEGATPDTIESVRSLVLELVQADEGTGYSRRRVPRADLEAGDPDRGALIDKLIDGRLLVTTEAEVELIHESLIAEWHLLREWVHQERERLRDRRAVDIWLTEWVRHRGEDEYLIDGRKLAVAEAVAARSGGRDLRELVQRSREKLTRARRRRAALAAGVFVTLLTATAVSLLFARRSREREAAATEARLNAESLYLASLSGRLLEASPSLALTTAERSFERSRTSASETALRRAFAAAAGSAWQDARWYEVRGPVVWRDRALVSLANEEIEVLTPRIFRPAPRHGWSLRDAEGPAECGWPPDTVEPCSIAHLEDGTVSRPVPTPAGETVVASNVSDDGAFVLVFSMPLDGMLGALRYWGLDTAFRVFRTRDLSLVLERQGVDDFSGTTVVGGVAWVAPYHEGIVERHVLWRPRSVPHVITLGRQVDDIVATASGNLVYALTVDGTLVVLQDSELSESAEVAWGVRAAAFDREDRLVLVHCGGLVRVLSRQPLRTEWSSRGAEFIGGFGNAEVCRGERISLPEMMGDLAAADLVSARTGLEFEALSTLEPPLLDRIPEFNAGVVTLNPIGTSLRIPIDAPARPVESVFVAREHGVLAIESVLNTHDDLNDLWSTRCYSVNLHYVLPEQIVADQGTGRSFEALPADDLERRATRLLAVSRPHEYTGQCDLRPIVYAGTDGGLYHRCRDFSVLSDCGR